MPAIELTLEKEHQSRYEDLGRHDAVEDEHASVCVVYDKATAAAAGVEPIANTRGEGLPKELGRVGVVVAVRKR